MNFELFSKALEKNVALMCATNARLFTTDVDPDSLWNLYLASFPEGSNPVYKTRTEHDCNCCKQFIRHFGGLVAIDPHTFQLVSIWDFKVDDPNYQFVISELASHVKLANITGQLVSTVALLGTEKSRAIDKETQVVTTWSHLHATLPTCMLYRGSKTEDSVRGQYRTDTECFERALTEITPASVDEVLELIAQNTLYKGPEWKNQLTAFKAKQSAFSKLPRKTQVRNDFCWLNAALSPEITRLRNSSIGTLLVDLSAGMELDAAVRRYEAVTAPSNYQRPKAIVTAATVAAAQKTITELGILPSMPHRFAHLDDITVNNTLWADRNARASMKGNALDSLMQDVKAKPPKLDKAQEIAWTTFVSDVLPKASSVEVLVEPKHRSNMVSLLAPVNPDAKRIFKWDNNFAWAYAGNLADSMKERVKAAGGKVDGVLRFSLQWNEDHDNENDMDAHCMTPLGEHIYFGHKSGHTCKGNLDVDNQWPGDRIAVENITWPSLAKMPDGTYKFSVHVYSHRNGRNGFRAEIETPSDCQNFDYTGSLHQGLTIDVAAVVKLGSEFTILPGLKGYTRGGRAVWGIPTATFHPVQAVMYSPNYWDGQDGESVGAGNRHLMFMLKDCVSDEQPNGFFNEFLRGELTPHRRVFEVLGARMAVEPDSNQLSGLGFSTTKRDTVTCRVSGKTERIFKVAF